MLLLTYSAEECFANFDIFIIYDLFRFFNRIFEIYYILSVCNRDVKERQKSQTCEIAMVLELEMKEVEHFIEAA